MNNPRTLLILFALAFLAIQVVSFMTGIASHEDRLVKLEKQLLQYETKGVYVDLKLDPAQELKKEKTRFRAETIKFILVVFGIAGATSFVYVMMKSDRGQKSG
ncbi:MAG: hypothetical protein ACYC0Q_13110 [Eubacteriales bacterium]